MKCYKVYFLKNNTDILIKAKTTKNRNEYLNYMQNN